ncbi:MAG TPA: HEAT repeat domain-containing protein, partial [Polyangia bacterium]|nr:HEAT repeat domain-containing protein [Polyangia bacterium]
RYRRPIVTNVYHEPIDIFDRHLYEKGSCVLHMLRTELGDERFWKAIRHYIAKHAGKSVETRDLARAVDEATGWNADRFFEQWVFKAGFPELKVEYSWDDEHKQARLAIAQTQKVEGETPLFDFPLPIDFGSSDGTTQRVMLRISAAQETFVLPLAKKPSFVVVDPGSNVLKSIDEKKAEELWTAQLANALRAVDRVRAARALGKAGASTAIAALVLALDEQSWIVRGEAAIALGAIKTAAARDAILNALPHEKHPKARRHLVKALGSFRHDEKAADAVASTLEGDPSYFVEAEGAMSLAKTRSPRAFEALQEAMSRPSYLDVIRSMCFAGMAELRDERGVEIAIAACKYGEPVTGRRAAISLLGALGAEFPPHQRRARETLSELLEDPDFRVRIAAVEALNGLGDSHAVGALKRAEHKDLDGRVRRRAREVARLLSEGATKDSQVRTLRDSVEKLQDENRELKERLSKLEARP